MRNLKPNYVIVSCLVVLFLITMSCTKSDLLGLEGSCETAWTTQVSAELDAYSASLTAFSNDPTAANCSNVKTSAKNYFDALGEALDCVPLASRAQINEAIDEAKADVDRDDCN